MMAAKKMPAMASTATTSPPTPTASLPCGARPGLDGKFARSVKIPRQTALELQSAQQECHDIADTIESVA